MPRLVAAGDSRWLITAGGQLLLSRDAGTTWQQRLDFSSPLGAPLGVTFPDQQHGWLVTTEATYATSDGGASWTAAHTPSPLMWAQFADPLHGWGIAQDGVLLSSIDGGVSWATIPTRGPVYSACLQTARTGFIGRGNPTVDFERTTDGGLTWAPSLSRGIGAPMTDLRCSASGVVATIVYQELQGAHGLYEVLTSVDGVTWRMAETNVDNVTGQAQSPTAGGQPDPNGWELPVLLTPAGHVVGVGVSTDLGSVATYGGVPQGSGPASHQVLTLPRRYRSFGFLGDGVFPDATPGSGQYIVSSNVDRALVVMNTTNDGLSWSLIAVKY